MKKYILLFCISIIVLLASRTSAQVKTGFKTVGNIEQTCSKIGAEVFINSDTTFENGGSFVKVTYQSFGERHSSGRILPGSQTKDGVPMENVFSKIETNVDKTSESTITSTKLSAGESPIANVVSGGQTIAGVNLIEARNDSILITRWVHRGTSEKTVYVLTKSGIIREATYAGGKIKKEQVLP